MNRATGALMLLIILFFRFCLYDSCPCRYVLCHPDVTAYGRITPDGNPAQNGGIGVYNHVIFQNRMTWNAFNRFAVSIQGEASGTQCHPLIEFHIVAPITTPVPWSIVKCVPILAPGCMSIPVSLCAISVMIRGISGTPNSRSSWAMR